jgi:hypothetical protein
MRVVLGFCFILAVQALLAPSANGQEVIKALRDYRSNTPRNYTPTDPNERGRIFNMHTGHAGAFYNCDDEEAKRNSPYICWKGTYQKSTPHRGLWRGLKMDIAEVKQRIHVAVGLAKAIANAKLVLNRLSTNRAIVLFVRMVEPTLSKPSRLSWRKRNECARVRLSQLFKM